MKIMGLQKLTLLDFPGRVACTVFTGGCNFRCPYCHNAPLVRGEGDELSQEDFFALLRKRRGVLDGVCVTGGEPLLQSGLEEFLERVREQGLQIKLDTNGSDPGRLSRLLGRGLADYVAMDIKNCRERYAETIGVPGFDPAPVAESVRLLMEGGTPYEFRTTVVRELHEEQDFVRIGRWLRGAQRYFLQAFRDSGELLSPGLHGCTKAEMERMRALLLPEIPSAQLRGVD